MRTKGFCSALLRCGEIKLIAEKREYAISDLIANIARTKRRRIKSFGMRNLVSPYKMCPASFSFSGLDGAEIALFPVTPTRIFTLTLTLTLTLS